MLICRGREFCNRCAGAGSLYWCDSSQPGRPDIPKGYPEVQAHNYCRPAGNSEDIPTILFGTDPGLPEGPSVLCSQESPQEEYRLPQNVVFDFTTKCGILSVQYKKRPDLQRRSSVYLVG